MRLTRAGEYAVRCVLYLSAQEEGKIVRRRDISKTMGVPGQFLGKIAQQLSRAGFLEIIQGAKGGIRLTASPMELNLLDVVEAIAGELSLNDCIIRPESCSRNDLCSVHLVWQKARRQLRETLREATFESMLQTDSRMNTDLLVQ